MKLKKLVKKTLAAYVCLVMFSNLTSSLTVYAKSEHKYSNDPGKNRVFKELVKKGYSESELYNLPENEVDALEKTDLNDVQVSVAYYRVSDDTTTGNTGNTANSSNNTKNSIDTLKSIDTTADGIERLDENEIDELLEEIGENPSQSNDSDSTTSNDFSLNPFSFLSSKVSARAVDNKNITKVCNKDEKDGYIRQTLIVRPGSDNRHFNVSLQCSWLKTPHNLRKDVIAITLSRASVVPNSSSGYTQFDYRDYCYDTDKYSKWNYQKFYMKTFYEGDNESASWGALKRNNYFFDKNKKSYRRVYEPASFLYMSCQIKTTGSDTFSVSGKYLHEEYKTTVTPGLGIDKSGPSISVTLDNKDLFKALGPNAYILYELR